MSIEQIASIYGWPLTAVMIFALAAMAFFVGRRLLDMITGKKR